MPISAVAAPAAPAASNVASIVTSTVKVSAGAPAKPSDSARPLSRRAMRGVRLRESVSGLYWKAIVVGAAPWLARSIATIAPLTQRGAVDWVGIDGLIS